MTRKNIKQKKASPFEYHPLVKRAVSFVVCSERTSQMWPSVLPETLYATVRRVPALLTGDETISNDVISGDSAGRRITTDIQFPSDVPLLRPAR